MKARAPGFKEPQSEDVEKPHVAPQSAAQKSPSGKTPLKLRYRGDYERRNLRPEYHAMAHEFPRNFTDSGGKLGKHNKPDAPYDVIIKSNYTQEPRLVNPKTPAGHTNHHLSPLREFNEKPRILPEIQESDKDRNKVISSVKTRFMPGKDDMKNPSQHRQGSRLTPWIKTSEPKTAFEFNKPILKRSGMINLGNTCYLNAVLQGLFSIPEFCSAICSLSEEKHSTLPDDGIIHSLCHCIGRLIRPNSFQRPEPIDPTPVKLAISKHTGLFNTLTQQDAHEFFVSLMETIESEISQMKGQRPQKVDPCAHIMNFSVENTIRCNCCGEITKVAELCNHLSLDITENSLTNQINSLKGMFETNTRDVGELLDGYFREETISKNCEHCQKKNIQHTVQKRFASLPRALILHLKRFQVVYEKADGIGNVRYVKINQPISVPPKLNLSHLLHDKEQSIFDDKENIEPVNAEDCPRTHPLQRSPSRMKETNTIASSFYRKGSIARFGASDPRYWEQSRRKGNVYKPKTEDEPCEVTNVRHNDRCSQKHQIDRSFFQLHAIINHHGEKCDSGHFTAIAKDDSGSWYRYNDSMVTYMGKSLDLSLSSYQRESYMLIYAIE